MAAGGAGDLAVAGGGADQQVGRGGETASHEGAVASEQQLPPGLATHLLDAGPLGSGQGR